MLEEKLYKNAWIVLRLVPKRFINSAGLFVTHGSWISPVKSLKEMLH
jgi:hypothetical protein